MNSTSQQAPKVLVLGASGLVGQKTASLLQERDGVSVRISSRRPFEVARLQSEGKDAVYLDLDDATTFGSAFAGVDRLFVLTGYSVAMVTQGKTIIDAAVKAGVRHLVHLGAFGEWGCTNPQFAWHQLIESYAKASGIAWTHLHPNMFMENLLRLFAPKRGVLTVYWRSQRIGWIAAADIAAVAATVLREGPDKHHAKDYFLSTEVATGPEVAAALGDAMGREIACEQLGPEDFASVIRSPELQMESWNAAGSIDFMQQVMDGRMGYIGSVRDDVQYVTGRPAITLRQWAAAHREQLIAATS